VLVDRLQSVCSANSVAHRFAPLREDPVRAFDEAAGAARPGAAGGEGRFGQIYYPDSRAERRKRRAANG
jgi:hypothetical protein